MRNQSRIVLLVLLLSFACSSAAEEISGRVNVLWDKPQLLQFVPDLKVYPGETIRLTASGSDSVDINHHYWEDRQCNWFGLHCWYEQRDQAKPKGPSELEIELTLENGKVEPQKGNGSGEFVVTYPLSANNANFREPARLSGKLWLPNNAEPSRTPCSGRPPYCSAGDLKLTVLPDGMPSLADLKPRLDALKEILLKQKDSLATIDPTAVTSRDFIDPLLFDPAVARKEVIGTLSANLTAVIGEYRTKLGETPAPAQHRKVIDLASYALKLTVVTLSDQAKLRVAIMDSYIARGEYAQATEEAPQTLAAAKTAYKSSSSVDNLLTYAGALRSNAIAWREKQARNSSADIRAAIAMLDEAAFVLWDRSHEDNRISAKISAVSVDAARMLNLLRTRAEIAEADERLVRAVCFQMYSEAGTSVEFKNWRNTMSDKAADCSKVEKPAQ